MSKKCNYYQLNHKDFDCVDCNENFSIRDDSKLNICFSCAELFCDNCFKKHLLETDERYNFVMFGRFQFMFEARAPYRYTETGTGTVKQIFFKVRTGT